MDDVRLKELRALCDAAQPGPWKYTGNKDGRIDTGPPDISDWEDGCVIYGVDRDEDARFIVEARTALPEALDEIERLRALLSETREAVASHPDYELSAKIRAVLGDD